VSTSALPVAAAPPGLLAASERIQRIRALVARIEHPGAAPAAGAAGVAAASGLAATPGVPSSGAATFASALSTAVASAAGSGLPSATAAPAAFAPLIEQAAARNGLSPALLTGLIRQESGFNPSARSSAGALGLTQLMPSTAASLGVAEPLDPAQSIEGGARYLAGMLRRFGGDTASALAAYNAGPGAVEQYGGVPPYPETQQYVAKVLAYAGAPSGAVA
jgi:soluble lytic murein transglycosylase-like protein